MKLRNSQNGISTTVVIGIIAVVAVIGIAAYFLTQKPSTQTTTDIQAEPTVAQELQSESNGDMAEGEVKSFKVTGSAFKFDPKTITVNEGDTVEIVFTNAQGTHDWVIDEFSARTKVLQAGSSETIKFKATKKGSFEYYCSVGNHRAMGMVGTLIVQ